MADISPITVARFWSKVSVPSSDTACWNWTGALAGSGYGSFHAPDLGKAAVSSHRVAYRLGSGEWPAEGELVRHKCDNPRCVNPFHLETGTHRDNSRDMLDRGRQAKRVQAGERNYNSKLTAADVDKVRNLISQRKSNCAIARLFGVHHATISRIRRGTSWTRLVPQHAGDRDE